MERKSYLLVDDEQLAVNAMHRILKKLEPDCEVFEFMDPIAALIAVSDGTVKPDVAFLDIEMFNMSGITLAKRLKDVCPTINVIFATGFSQYAVEAFGLHASGYLLKPVTEEDVKKELDNLRSPVNVVYRNRVRIQTFGAFQIFIDGEPAIFARTKAKELLAIIVDKNGASCSVQDFADILFPGKPLDRLVRSQIQTIIATLMKTLKDAGVDDILFKHRNAIAINKDKVDCDYFHFLEGDVAAVNRYRGEYMENYPWAVLKTENE